MGTRFFRSVSLLFMVTAFSQAGFAANQEERLQTLIDSDTRSVEARARNQYRHPFETLQFFGLQAEQTVVEIWPGGRNGWYRSILQPFFADQSGRYIAVMSNSSFPDQVTAVADGTADMVLVFRAHGFLIYDQALDKYYAELYRMLKPGGVFGIVDHRELESRLQDPKSENGYVQQSYVINLAEKAGFELVATAEINANPLDTKDYPDGLYSLPPTLRGSLLNRALRRKVLEIGESDRMTLKFMKPVD